MAHADHADERVLRWSLLASAAKKLAAPRGPDSIAISMPHEPRCSRGSTSEYCVRDPRAPERKLRMSKWPSICIFVILAMACIVDLEPDLGPEIEPKTEAKIEIDIEELGEATQVQPPSRSHRDALATQSPVEGLADSDMLRGDAQRRRDVDHRRDVDQWISRAVHEREQHVSSVTGM
jgi:hypothetical protein